MSNWIPFTGPGRRMPTREDADEREEVIWKFADGATITDRYDHRPNERPVAWLPMPPYVPPKAGPTDEEIRLLFVGARGNSWVAQDIRRWFADVTARIEREKRK